jgi:hypothetical protein
MRMFIYTHLQTHAQQIQKAKWTMDPPTHAHNKQVEDNQCDARRTHKALHRYKIKHAETSRTPTCSIENTYRLHSHSRTRTHMNRERTRLFVDSKPAAWPALRDPTQTLLATPNAQSATTRNTRTVPGKARAWNAPSTRAGALRALIWSGFPRLSLFARTRICMYAHYASTLGL